MTKDTVLAILKKAEGYVSGQEISGSLGVSRAAVNSAIKLLRSEGYDIMSSTNRGYMLCNAPDYLNTGELLALLPEERMEKIICLDTVGSTNNYLRDLALGGAPAGQIVIANEQTLGRGRRGRSFISPRNRGIYMSMLLRPDSLPLDISSMTAWTAVAMCNAIETMYKIRPGIKWVNDLVLSNRKICGILTEMSLESESGHIQHIIVGVGVNVNGAPDDFPPEISEVATTLLEQTGQRIPRARLACRMIKELDKVQNSWPDGKREYLDAYRSDCITLGKQICIDMSGTKKAGVAQGIDDSFGLIALFEDGSAATITSGEVSVRGLYGYA